MYKLVVKDLSITLIDHEVLIELEYQTITEAKIASEIIKAGYDEPYFQLFEKLDDKYVQIFDII